MIKVRLKGGLGNQMFQFAAGFSLSKRLNTNLVIDTYSYQVDALRNYELDGYQIKTKLEEENNFNLIESAFNRVQEKNVCHEFVESSLASNYDKAFESIVNDTVVKGSFHSEKYFIDCEEKIRRKFTINLSSIDSCKKILSKISDSNSISLHVRRGDYVTNEDIKKSHNHLKSNYYINAIKYMRESFDNFKLFVFTDDAGWVREYFEIKEPFEIVSYEGAFKNNIELQLMSHCKHHIIANSAYSWWGAWLNASRNKKVIAPRKWFHEGQGINDCRLPESWIQI